MDNFDLLYNKNTNDLGITNDNKISESTDYNDDILPDWLNVLGDNKKKSFITSHKLKRERLANFQEFKDRLKSNKTHKKIVKEDNAIKSKNDDDTKIVIDYESENENEIDAQKQFKKIKLNNHLEEESIDQNDDFKV